MHGGDGQTHKIRASLFRRSKKKPIWTPKMISEVDRAVRKATMLMPADVWAEPLPESSVDVVVAAAAAVVVLDMATAWRTSRHVRAGRQRGGDGTTREDGRLRKPLARRGTAGSAPAAAGTLWPREQRARLSEHPAPTGRSALGRDEDCCCGAVRRGSDVDKARDRPWG